MIFGPLGGALLSGSLKIQNVQIDYTDCLTQSTNEFSTIPTNKYSQNFNTNSSSGLELPPEWRHERNTSSNIANASNCIIRFTLPTDLNPPVLFYYKLTNFFQNHRRYVKSVLEAQLNGKALTADEVLSHGTCTPLQVAPDGKPYYPCGLVANSLFNDTFLQPVLLNAVGTNNANETYNMTTQGIAWSSDRQRFQKTSYNASQVAVPPNWVERYPDGYTEENLPDLSTMYEFQVSQNFEKNK